MINNKGRFCPNCKTVYESDNVTICLKCGYPTHAKVVTKGEINADILGEQLRPEGERTGVLNPSKEFKSSIRKK